MIKTITYTTLLAGILGVLIYVAFNIKIEITQHQTQHQDQSQHQSQNTIVVSGHTLKDMVFKVDIVQPTKIHIPNASWHESSFMYILKLDKYKAKPLGISWMTPTSSRINRDGYYIGYWDIKTKK